jgi:hypothetical protein
VAVPQPSRIASRDFHRGFILATPSRYRTTDVFQYSLHNLSERRVQLPTMANYLASIFGTEQDKVNCSFYYKIGACRHGDRCSRKHVKPSYSQTILLPNLYQNPAYDPKNKMNKEQMQLHFDAFYEDIWCELCQYGLVEEVVVCDNNNDRKLRPHLCISSG